MFNSIANVACNNTLFRFGSVPPMSEEYDRLVLAAQTLHPQEVSERPSTLARFLNISQQRLKNWKERGVPKEQMGALAMRVGCRPLWLEFAQGEMVELRPDAPGTKIPPEPVTNAPGLSPPPGTHEASSGAISSTAPAITYEVVKGAVAGVLQALGVRYEDLVEDDSTARHRVEAVLGITAEPEKPVDNQPEIDVMERLAKIGGEMIYDGKRVIPRKRGESGRKKKPA